MREWKGKATVMLLQTPVAWYLLPEARMSKFRLLRLR